MYTTWNVLLLFWCIQLEIFVTVLMYTTWNVCYCFDVYNVECLLLFWCIQLEMFLSVLMLLQSSGRATIIHSLTFIRENCNVTVFATPKSKVCQLSLKSTYSYIIHGSKKNKQKKPPSINSRANVTLKFNQRDRNWIWKCKVLSK